MEISQENSNKDSLLDLFSKSTNSKEALKHMKCVLEQYLNTFSLEEVEEKLLVILLPTVKQHLEKIFNDNSFFFDSMDDDIVVELIKDNIHVSNDYMSELKYITNSLAQHETIQLSSIKDTFVNLLLCMNVTFHHCRNSSEQYRQKFNINLQELSISCEEMYMTHLGMFKNSVLVTNETDKIVLNTVLDCICQIADTLSHNHAKLTIETWKYYTMLTQKYQNSIIDSINLKLAVNCLTSLIDKQLETLVNFDKSNEVQITNVIKFCCMFIRILTNLFQLFWDVTKNICKDLMQLLYVIYRFPFDTIGYSSSTITLVENIIFKPIEQLLANIVDDLVFFEIFCMELKSNTLLNTYASGRFNLLIGILKTFMQTKKTSPDFCLQYLKLVFEQTALQTTESFSNRNNLTKLIVNATAFVIITCKHRDVEYYLLSNILQGNPYKAVLSIEVWSLYLENIPTRCRYILLDSFLKKVLKLDFGTFTRRPEQIYINIFIRKVFKMLSHEQKIEFTKKYPPKYNLNVWKYVSFTTFPQEQMYMIEELIEDLLKNKLQNDQITNLKEFVTLIDALNLLSTVNSNSLTDKSDRTKFVEAVIKLWDINFTQGHLRNNFVKLVFPTLSKVLRNFRNSSPPTHYNMILNKLEIFSKSSEYVYKSIIADVLPIFNNPEMSKPYNNHIIINLSNFIKNILNNNKDTIIYTQLINEILHIKSGGSFQNSKTFTDSIVKIVPDDYFCDEMSTCFDQMLGQINHTCIEWREIDLSTITPTKHIAKKFKTDEGYSVETLSHTAKYKRKSPIENCRPFRNKGFDENAEVETSDCAQDVIARLKSEVKCLLNVTKTEKLTPKNCSDLRIVMSQLSSLM